MCWCHSVPHPSWTNRQAQAKLLTWAHQQRAPSSLLWGRKALWPSRTNTWFLQSQREKDNRETWQAQRQKAGAALPHVYWCYSVLTLPGPTRRPKPSCYVWAHQQRTLAQPALGEEGSPARMVHLCTVVYLLTFHLKAQLPSTWRTVRFGYTRIKPLKIENPGGALSPLLP